MSKLLLVDDDANTLASLARAFRLAGHEAVVCDNADRALELAKAQRFDMILSDVVMPGKDGLTLLGELKAAGVQTPVVMVSGQANIEMAVRATRLGAIDFLEKPLSTEKLLMTVENTVKAVASGGRKSPAEAAGREAGAGLEIRRDAGSHGQSGARRGQRDARLYFRRNRHGQRIGRAHAAREEPAPRWPVHDAELRRCAGGADRIRTLRS